MRFIRAIGKASGLLLIGIVRIYQHTLSRVLPPTCRFEPSCSEYMIKAIGVHGPVKGLLLGLWRILRCNPFSRGGYDPVPPPGDQSSSDDGATRPGSKQRN